VLLVRAIGFHWHAVQRDLLVLGLRAADMFTPRLTASEVVSLIIAAPPGSSVYHVLDNGTMLASLQLNQPDWLRKEADDPPEKTQSVFKSIADYEAHRAKVIEHNGRR
jgi:hypothetical protein